MAQHFPSQTKWPGLRMPPSPIGATRKMKPQSGRLPSHPTNGPPSIFLRRLCPGFLGLVWRLLPTSETDCSKTQDPGRKQTNDESSRNHPDRRKQTFPVTFSWRLPPPGRPSIKLHNGLFACVAVCCDTLTLIGLRYDSRRRERTRSRVLPPRSTVIRHLFTVLPRPTRPQSGLQVGQQTRNPN